MPVAPVACGRGCAPVVVLRLAGQVHGDLQPAERRVGQLDAGAVQLGNARDDGQAEARTLAVTLSIEALEQLVTLRRRHPGAAVVHL